MLGNCLEIENWDLETNNYLHLLPPCVIIATNILLLKKH